MSSPSNDGASWRPWVVEPRSGFEVDDPAGQVALIQIDTKRFVLTKAFRFTDPEVQRMLVARLERNGATNAEAAAAVDSARTFNPSTENPTDLASVPRFMRWFESSYGAHTLAAIIHDDLIVDRPNGGRLSSDTLSDRFFREMLRSASVPWLKRWIMWAAVALRSRWAAGGARRASLLLWLVLAAAGMAAFVWAVGSASFGWASPVDTPVMFLIAIVAPVPVSTLWGRQYGAGLVASAAALWILPAGVLAGIGYLVYRALEAIAHRLGAD